MDDLHWENLIELRDFMFRNVYRSSLVKREEDLAKVEAVIKGLYSHFRNDPSGLPSEYIEIAEEEGPETAAKDFVASMTDRYAVNMYTALFGEE